MQEFLHGKNDSPCLSSRLPPLALHLEPGTCRMLLSHQHVSQCCHCAQLESCEPQQRSGCRDIPNGTVVALLCDVPFLVTAILQTGSSSESVSLRPRPWQVKGLVLDSWERIELMAEAVSPWPPETLLESLPRSLPCPWEGRGQGAREKKAQHKATIHPGPWCLQAGKLSPQVL